MTFINLASICVLAICTAGPAFAYVTKHGDFRIEYENNQIGQHRALDAAVQDWMTQQDIHAAQLAVRKNGKLIFSHAYTLGKKQELVTTRNVFRLASVSKMLVTAAYSQLLTSGALTGTEHVFDYLGIHKPLLKSQTPDPRIGQITVEELYEHTSGMPASGDGDPLFEMRDIEVKLGKEPLSDKQFAKYLYGIPLIGDPGETEVYSNVGYFLLAEVIQTAVGKSYYDYVQGSLLHPIGLTNWTLSPTSQMMTDPNEVYADNPDTGPSVFDITKHAPIEPFAFEGGDVVWEVTAGPADFVTNAESVSAFIHLWNVYGLNGRQYDYARSGCLPGVATWAESLNADIDFSLVLNKQPCLDFSSEVIQRIEAQLGGL